MAGLAGQIFLYLSRAHLPIVMLTSIVIVLITGSDGSSAGGGAPGVPVPEGALMQTAAAVNPIIAQQQHTPPLSLLPRL